MEQFFAYARERHSIYLRRRAGQSAPWTDDPVLHKHRFTNVFRELDATTIWFRENVREPMRSDPDVLLATVLFRWFNRITTGEAIFCQQIHDKYTPFELLLDNVPEQSLDYVGQAIRAFCGKGPYVTGAYIIKTPDGYDKLNGVLKSFEWFMTTHSRITFEKGVTQVYAREGLLRALLDNPGKWCLEHVWQWLRGHSFIGDFMAYEIVTDLRHTVLLDKAPDIMTWANPGPGAMRGLNRLHGRPLNGRGNRERFIQEMRDILECSQWRGFWPQVSRASGLLTDPTYADLIPSREADDWPAWEMRDVEHTLCEFDKYERARLGEGRPRGVYHHVLS